MSDYKKSLNLPDTSFPMKANLTQREPEMLRWWEENNIYGTMLEASGSRGSFRLHDGPPYANGHLHLGHALNKILKDITIKSRNIQGQQSVYVPGWDCHGLPIELKVEHELGEKKKEMPPYAVRRRCRQYADKFIDIQRKEFKRLGVLGDWDHPYKTMLPEYESATATELANFVEKGNVVRSKKPIYWCCSCQTALAEAEVEYADHKSPSIYVRFPLTDDRLKTVFENADPSRAYVIIWTTTPWTLPSNMAVALHPEFEYSLVEYEGSQYVLATELVESVAKACGWDMGGVKAVGTATGQQLELVKARHPFYDRESPLILGGHKFTSRFILGSGRYDLNLIKATIENAGTQIVTMALRRCRTTENNLLDYIPKGITMLPNTSGARNAEEAVRIARLAREVCQTDFVKVEIEHEAKYLLPDNEETIKATKQLAKEGFVVMPYMFPDPIAAKRLEDAGAACVMPLGAMIGSNKGLRARDFIEVIIKNSNVPVIIDAGIGRPSQAAEAMEMGADAVMAYTAIASAGNIPLMARAFKKAIEAGREAYLSGLGKVTEDHAVPSSPTNEADYIG